MQKELQVLRDNVNSIKTNSGSASHQSRGDGRMQEEIMPQSGIQDPMEKISGTSWAEEMDILNSALEEEPDDAA